MPQDRIGTYWKPTLEAVAAGVAAADFGGNAYGLMGLSAARLHMALPGAIAMAIVAVPGVVAISH